MILMQIQDPIIQWLRKTQYNDEERVQVLRAWLKACLVGKGHELQRFLRLLVQGDEVNQPSLIYVVLLLAMVITLRQR